MMMMMLMMILSSSSCFITDCNQTFHNQAFLLLLPWLPCAVGLDQLYYLLHCAQFSRMAIWSCVYLSFFQLPLAAEDLWLLVSKISFFVFFSSIFAVGLFLLSITPLVCFFSQISLLVILNSLFSFSLDVLRKIRINASFKEVFDNTRFVNFML